MTKASPAHCLRLHPAPLCEAGRRLCGNQLKICTVVGFPNGYSTPEVKVFETEDAIRGGADEIDMVADLGLVKSGDWEGGAGGDQGGQSIL